MLQEIAPEIYNREYREQSPTEESVIFCFDGQKLLVKKAEVLTLVRYREFCRLGASAQMSYRYLFEIEGTGYFLAKGILSVTEDDGYGYVPVRTLRGGASKRDCYAASTAYQLYVWYRDHVYCGRCGKALKHDRSERRLYCPECRCEVYPKLAPAVIVGVLDGGRILMTKYADRDYKKYALIAGFCEIGETAEDTVRREVYEETGLRVKNIRYYKSQPWGFDSNLLFGYFADLDGTDQIRLDEKELAVAEWKDRKDAAGMDDGISLTREMMGAFAQGSYPR